MIRREITQTDSEYDREKLQERLAKLAGGVAQINVGAATETEMKERKALVEDALHATRAAIEEGVVPGGGTALIRAPAALDELKLAGDEAMGVTIIRRPSSSPPATSPRTPAIDGAVVVNKIQKSKERPLRLQRRERPVGRHVRRRDRRPDQGHPLGPPERRVRRRPPPDHRGPHRRAPEEGRTRRPP